MGTFINIVRVMILTGHVARMGEITNIYITFWMGNMKGRDHLEDLRVNGRIILECILGK
jgi:hypothetical protein